jgi:hypothetical protein
MMQVILVKTMKKYFIQMLLQYNPHSLWIPKAYAEIAVYVYLKTDSGNWAYVSILLHQVQQQI